MSSRTGFDMENYNRVFVLGVKDCSVDEVKECFCRYGNVKDVYFVHKSTKGICYITFSKASEAALAIEEMNGKCVPGHDSSLKVILANSRSEGSVREPQEDEKMRRLFIMVDRNMLEEDIEREFQKYGQIDYVRLVKEKNGASRGLAYVKYVRAYDAAVALETCPGHYKAVFAAAKPSRDEGGSSRGSHRDDYGDRRHSGGGGRGGGRDFLDAGLLSLAAVSAIADRARVSNGDVLDQLRHYPHNGETVLEVSFPSLALKDMVTKLFEIVPGMEYSTFDRQLGTLTVRYSMPQMAAYARDKLDRYEILPGSFVTVRLCRDNSSYQPRDTMGLGLSNTSPDITALFQTLQNATSILSQVGALQGGGGSSLGGGLSQQAMEDGSYCSVPLPRRCPILDDSVPTAERLFVVSTPDAFSDEILTDLFCRFGSMINAYFMSGKKCGYVKYASRDSANKAIDTLHGANVLGNRLKVMRADPPRGTGGGGGLSEKRGWTGGDVEEGYAGDPSNKYSRFD